MIQVAGIIGTLVIPLYDTYTIIWPPADRPISQEVVEDYLDNIQMDSCYLAPSLLEEMSQSQTMLEKLAKLEHVKFGGGQAVSTER